MKIVLARVLLSLVIVGSLGSLGSMSAHAQTSRPAASTVAIDLTDPQKALASFFAAQKANDRDAINKTVTSTVPDRKQYVEDCITYQMWARYLEHLAIAKFGKEPAIAVQGHVRSLDDQTDLDLKRVKEAGIEYNSDHTDATVHLRVERDRPDELKIDDFQFLDTYYLVKTPAGWQVDYLKTCNRLDPDSDASYKAELGAFPRMARNLKQLCDQLKAGKFATADDLKNRLDTLWTQVYSEPTDASGRTQKDVEAEAPATAPATAPARQ
jgi:hypothetical protein